MNYQKFKTHRKNVANYTGPYVMTEIYNMFYLLQNMQSTIKKGKKRV